MSSLTQKPKLWQSFLLISIGILFSLVLLEISIRVYLTYFGTEQQRGTYLYTNQQIYERQIIIGAPYLNYILNPDQENINSLSYRGAEIIQPKPEGTFRIVALGGSTTYGVGITNNNDTYPAQLELILQEEYNFNNVEVINGGIAGYASYESLVSFQFRVLDLNPDMIIIYHGIVTTQAGTNGCPSKASRIM